MSSTDCRAIELLLFQYREIPLLIRKNDLEIRMISNDFDTLKGKSHNEIKASTSTNVISSAVENHLIDKEQRISQLKEENQQLEYKREMMQIALDSLGDESLNLIKARYVDGMSVRKMSELFNCTEDCIYKACRRIIKNELSKYITV